MLACGIVNSKPILGRNVIASFATSANVALLLNDVWGISLPLDKTVTVPLYAYQNVMDALIELFC